MLQTDFPPWPAYTREEADAVFNVLSSNEVNYWTGTQCHQFEREFAEWAGAGYAVAVNNGTVALEAALHALGIGPGDDVIVTPRTFVASASCVVMAGARPVFADVDFNSQNIMAETIAGVLTPRCKAVVCVHLAGMPCEMDSIIRFAKDNGLYVIEDCSQAHGARYKGRSVGTMGDIGTWSFCQDKIMTTGGEGGMLTTNDPTLWSRLWSYKDHGKSWDAVYRRKHSRGFRWLHEAFGTNGRMLEMQAVLGRLQLRWVDEWVLTRRRFANRIWEAASQLRGLHAPRIPSWAEHAAYKCYVFVEKDELSEGWSRDRIMERINECGVPCYTGSCPEVYLEKAFAERGLAPENRLPTAKLLGESSLMFLVHPTLTEEHISTTCHVLSDVMVEATASGSA